MVNIGESSSKPDISNQVKKPWMYIVIVNFEQEIEIIVNDKQTAFLRATPEGTKEFPQPKFKVISPVEDEVSLRSYHEKSDHMSIETSSWTRDLSNMPRIT